MGGNRITIRKLMGFKEILLGLMENWHLTHQFAGIDGKLMENYGI